LLVCNSYIIYYNSPLTVTTYEELQPSGDIPILVHESFKKDLDSFHAKKSHKTSVSTSILPDLKPKKLPPPLPDDNSAHKSLSKSKSDSLIHSKSNGMLEQSEDSEPHNLTPNRKDSKVKEAFFKHLNVTEQQEKTTDMANQKQQTESSMDMADQIEETKSSTDMVNKEEEPKLSTDMANQKEESKSSTDMVNKEEEPKLSTDMANQKEETKSLTNMADQKEQTKPISTIWRQMNMNNPYMKHTLKREHKNKQNVNSSIHLMVNNNDSKTADSPAETSSSNRQSWGSNMSDFSHLAGTIKEFSKVYTLYQKVLLCN